MTHTTQVRVTFLPSAHEARAHLPNDFVLALRSIRELAKVEGGTVALQGSSPDAAVSILVEFGKTVGPFLGPALGTAVSGWFRKRAGRKLQLQVGDIEVEASNQAELEQLLELAIEIQERQSKPKPTRDHD